MPANVRIAGSHVRRLRVAGGMGVLALSLACVQPVVAQSEAAASSTVDIARLISQLDDDEYRVRQEATRRLSRGGVAAVAPLAKVAAGDDLESAFRAFAALKELGCADDAATEEAAFTALESLAAAGSPTAERAKSVLVGMRAASQQRAKERLRELGATITENNNGNDFAGPVFIGGGGVIMARGGAIVGGVDTGIYVPGASVEIDENWIGKATDLRFLRRLDNVGRIVLSGEQVTDDWLRELKGFSAANVQYLEFRRTKVTDAGLEHLAGFTSLARLDFLYTPITDNALGTLAKFSNVRYVRIYGTKITADGASALAAKLPDARIDRRGGALLGVGGSIGEQPCTISTVQPDSAAAKAGILENDVILRFDGTAVADFTELTAAISEKIGGEKVEIELLRPTVDAAPKSLKVTVTLGEW